MKRSGGIKLLVGFLIVFIGYLVWSAHPFFMGSKLKFKVPVPPEAKRVIEEFYAKHEADEPETFSASAFAYYLFRPYRAGVTHYEVTRESLVSFRINRRHYGAYFIVLKDGSWEIDRRMLIY